MADEVVGWKELGSVLPTALGEARTSLHWAAQVPSAAGVTLLEKKADFSHTSLRWDHALDGLVSQPIGEGENAMRVALRFAPSPRLAVLRAASTVEEIELNGHTLEEALVWTARRLDASSVTRPEHEMPDHGVGLGVPFGPFDNAAVLELSRWYADADLVLSRVVLGHMDKAASPVRVWPHHFDIATLMTIREGTTERGGATTIGVGMSPGDASYAQPYFYVTPWPYPPRGTTLPALRSGQWHIEGWTGAVLLGDAIAGAANAAMQRSIVETFLSDSIAGCEALLGSV